MKLKAKKKSAELISVLLSALLGKNLKTPSSTSYSVRNTVVDSMQKHASKW